jgi:hypothetical protein
LGQELTGQELTCAPPGVVCDVKVCMPAAIVTAWHVYGGAWRVWTLEATVASIGLLAV